MLIEKCILNSFSIGDAESSNGPGIGIIFEKARKIRPEPTFRICNLVAAMSCDIVLWRMGRRFRFPFVFMEIVHVEDFFWNSADRPHASWELCRSGQQLGQTAGQL